MPQEARVGLKFTQEGIPDVLREIGNLAAALEQFGRVPVNTLNPLLPAGGAPGSMGQIQAAGEPGTYASGSFGDGNSVAAPPTAPYTTTGGPSQPAGGANIQSATINVGTVATLNVQTAQVVNIYGASGVAGGAGTGGASTGGTTPGAQAQSGGGGSTGGVGSNNPPAAPTPPGMPGGPGMFGAGPGLSNSGLQRYYTEMQYGMTSDTYGDWQQQQYRRFHQLTGGNPMRGDFQHFLNTGELKPDDSPGRDPTDLGVGGQFGRAIGWGTLGMMALGAATSFNNARLSGGDMTSAQFTMDLMRNTVGHLPILGGPLMSFLMPGLQKQDMLDNTMALLRTFHGDVGLITDKNGVPDDQLSPTYLQALAGATQQGLTLPRQVRERFSEPATFDDPNNFLGVGRANPRYVHPAIRALITEAYMRQRSSQFGMGTFGYGADVESPHMDQPMGRMAALALASGSYSDAMLLYDFVGDRAGADEARLQGTWDARINSRVALLQSNIAAGTGAQAALMARGLNTSSQAALTYSYGANQASLALQDTELRDRLANLRSQQSRAFRNGDMEATQAILYRINETLAQISQSETQGFALATQQAQMPVDIGTQRGLSAAGFTGTLAGIQGNYGAVPGTLIQSNQLLGNSISQVQNMREEQRRQGTLTPAAEQVYQERLQQLELQRAGLAMQFASNPLDIRTQSGLSQSQYQIQVLESVPGAYGNLRGAMSNQMGLLQEAAGEVQARYQQQRAAGMLTPAAEFRYQQELQQLGLQQLHSFQQLSYGWENRLISRLVNAPGGINLDARGMSYMNAVMAGVRNPHFGMRQGDVPFFLQQAMLQNIPVSGLPGVRGLPGYSDRGQGLFGAPGAIPGFAGGAVGGPMGDQGPADTGFGGPGGPGGEEPWAVSRGHNGEPDVWYHPAQPGDRRPVIAMSGGGGGGGSTSIGSRTPTLRGGTVGAAVGPGSINVNINLTMQDPSGRILGTTQAQGAGRVTAGEVGAALQSGATEDMLNAMGIRVAGMGW